MIAAWDLLRARPLALLLAASAAAKLAYVFLFTRYPEYLFSDFYGYWYRAHQRMAGAQFDPNQWAFSQPLPHILLSWYLRLVDLLGLKAWELEATLVLNVAASTACVGLLYGIALRVLGSRGWALAVAALYAFTWPLLYFNAFVMSEHPAELFMLAGLWLALRSGQDLRALAGAGALLGLAAATRPAFGVLGLPVALYFAFAGGALSPPAVKRAAVFSAGFFLVVLGAAAEMHRISNGRQFGLSANGEQNLYFAQCRPASMSFTHLGRAYGFGAPSFVNRPEYGTVEVDLPDRQQGYLRALAWRCFREEPNHWGVLTQRAGDLFFGPLLPSVGSAAGFRQLLPPFRWFLLGCMLVTPLAFAARRMPGVSSAALALIGGMLGISLAMLGMFSVEHRFLYPLLPFVYLLLGAALFALVREPRRMAKPALVWGAVVAAFALATAGIEAARWWGAPPAVSTKVLKFPEAFVASTQAHQLAESISRRLHSPPGERLWPRVGIGEVAFALHATCMNVREAGLYELQVVAAGGFTLQIDGANALLEQNARPEVAYKTRLDLRAGRHRYALRMYGPFGVTATWRRFSSPASALTPGVGLHYIGEPGAEAVFLPPERC